MKNADYSEQHDSLSRRNFLAGVGVLTAGGVVATSLLPNQASADEIKPEETDPAAVGRVFDGMDLAIGRVVHNQDICSGCRLCECVCSVYHEGVASPSLSRIRAFKNVMDACITDIKTCKQCAGAECVAACPNDAMSVDSETGARIIDEKACVGCQVCLYACPVEPSRIKYNEKKNICFKCNLCDGEPQCVKFCPTGALTASWVEVEDASAENELYEMNFTGDAMAWTHIETSTLILDESGSGITLDGVLWTSHATQFNVILCVYEVTADFYDTKGELLGSSDNSGHIEIPEMSSGEFALTWATSNTMGDIGKIVIKAESTTVTNTPEQEG